MNNIWISALIAVIPIVIFLISLVVFKLKGYIAGLLSIISSAIISVFIYKMPMDKVAGAAAIVGLVNKDSEIFSKTIKWSVLFLVFAGVLNFLLTM